MEGSSETLKDDGDKKSPFDDLNREELVKKCKGLLMLAQKCKVSKSDLQNELESYKFKLKEKDSESKVDKESLKTLQELVNSLTEQKLVYTNEKDAAQNKIKSLIATCKIHEEHINKYKADIIVKNDKIAEISNLLSNLDSEAISLKRQNGRLLQENEQLINQLSEMEGRIEEFNKIGLQQQEQLQLLENEVQPDNTCDANKLKEKITELENEIVSLKNLNEENGIKNTNFNTKLNDIEGLYNLEKEKNDKLNNKLRSYKDKILKCASCINQLKNSRYILTKTVKEYSDCIPKWQNEIIKASKILDNQLNGLNNEIKTLRERLNSLENEYKNIIDRNIHLAHEKKELDIQNQELRNTIHSINENNSSNSLENLQLHVKSLESEKSILVKEKLNARDYALDIENQLKVKSQELDDIKIELSSLKTELNATIQDKNDLIRAKSKEKDSELVYLRNELKSTHQQLESLKKDNDNLLDFNGILKEEVETLKFSLEQPNDSDNVSQESASLQTDIVKLEAKISTLQQDNAKLLAETKESRNKVKEYDALISEYEVNKENLLSYKKENSELLLEMKEINQVLKERGENISKQQKAIAEMERLIEKIEADRDCIKEEKDDLEKRNIIIENELQNTKQLSSKENNEIAQVIIERDNALKSTMDKDILIASLKDDIEKLKNQQISSADLPNEDMSTSTISRAEEHSRMKDLDDTFEDRYSKLRLFAVKLKKKLNETTGELQNIKKDKANLEKLLSENRINIEEGKNKSSNLDNNRNDTFKISNDNTKIDELKQKLDKEIEVTNVLKEEAEKLKADLAHKEQQLKTEIDAHKATKEILDKTKKDVKKKNVLSLEMEDYERSMKELTVKMEEKQKKMVQLESTLDTQQGTITTMRTQIKLLEDQIKIEEKQNRTLKEELQCTIEEIKSKQNVISAKNEIITKIEHELEDYKRKFEEMNVELTTVLGEKEKAIVSLSEDKLELNNKVKKLEFKCAELEDKHKIMGIELEDLKTEYTSYKVRAQAVLRQNQTVDHSQEEQLKEETAALKVHVNTLTSKLNTVQEQFEELKSFAENEKRRCNELANEASRASQRNSRLQGDLARLTAQLDAERTQNTAQVSTLTQCYKTQISELEAKLAKETEELRRKLASANESVGASDAQLANTKPLDILYHKEDGSDVELDINMTMLPREEGEGSEAAPSPPLSKQMGGGRRSPMPLERLLEEGVSDHDIMEPPSLALTPEQELADLRRQLQAQLQRVKHVTVLLAESEREGARASQMNELLKAELRRARDSMERTHHAHNAEYIKNVVLKFATLPPGDERGRLVPVLQKILTLNSEETQKMSAVAKGLDPNATRGWGSYLPWSGGAK